MRAFRLTDPLPDGTVVLEASAGTGKTYTIAALAARYVAEGRVRIDDLLVVTFSRAATAELRSRVREKIRDAARALRVCLATGELPDDPAVRVLAGTGDDLAERSARLEDAFQRFDAATIMTTHEFCQGMIHGLGVLAAQEPQSILVEDLTPLVDEVSEDLYLQRYAGAARQPFPYVKFGQQKVDARGLARAAVEFPGEIGPSGLAGDAGERVEFARLVRAEVERRKARQRVFSFDDQLRRLRDALAAPHTGAQARAKLAARFPVVLIDEFQDTDPVQWQILRSAFDGAATLVLIGDPKQAIYAFRGADVHTYSVAVNEARGTTTLGTNHRSDPHVVDAVSALFRGVLLGDDIAAPPVTAQRTDRRVVAEPGSPWEAGVQLRVVDNEAPLWKSTANQRIAADLVDTVAGLLSERAPLARRSDADGRPAPLHPQDIAVLVRSNYRGHDIARALNAAGIPAAFSGTASVFSTPAADDWLTLLTALDQPRRPYLQRAVLTDFIGGDLTALAQATDDDWSTWAILLRSWAGVFAGAGVPALLRAIEQETGLTERLLARQNGERTVTDHRHLAELLHRRAHGRSVHLRDLVEWLTRAIGEATDVERTRRLETDDEAVQIMTVHRAKGLQFPVVLLPEASTGRRDEGRDEGQRLVLPGRDHWLLDIGGPDTPGREQRFEQFRRDEADENLRSLYVAMTRAQSHVVAWWAYTKEVGGSPLHRLLHAAHDAEHPAAAAYGYWARGGDHGSPAGMEWLSGAGVAVHEVGEASARPARALSPASELSVREWNRTVDHQWRRTSYSGLTAEAHAAPLDTGLVLDEVPAEVAVAPDPTLAVTSPMATLPSGPAFGTLVHAIYERLDARGDEWRETLAALTGQALAEWPLPGLAAPELAEALEPSLTTPLGPLSEGTTLRSFGPGSRLTELDFEFPLEAPRATLADVADLLRRHLPPGDPLASYPDRIAGPTLTTQRLHGFLTGSIDAVLRLPSGRHLIVDYKTNRLGTADLPPEALTIGHYTPPAVAEAMMASHYPLQALLYAVALHRFLGQRLPGYDPDAHLAGTAYLFVRGMAGPQTPLVGEHPLGVFSWRPSPELVAAVSALLAGGAR
ncbi:UvrD-helicase domain-containing protein [Nigerium massiliense]|uniref:UvrD-helicase domain-containing protein n=1 Tax=Nigerium massiliense TaxID=1522317 RepID=UPI00058DE4D3|nr:UvrD-helicase domain-containing protein [Nigerium massiliense]